MWAGCCPAPRSARICAWRSPGHRSAGRTDESERRMEVRAANWNPWEPGMEWRNGAERAGAARPLHGASPARCGRTVPDLTLRAAAVSEAGPGQEMRRAGSRREPALSPEAGWAGATVGPGAATCSLLTLPPETPNRSVGLPWNPWATGVRPAVVGGCGPRLPRSGYDDEAAFQRFEGVREPLQLYPQAVVPGLQVGGTHVQPHFLPLGTLQHSV